MAAKGKNDRGTIIEIAGPVLVPILIHLGKKGGEYLIERYIESKEGDRKEQPRKKKKEDTERNKSQS